MDPIYLDYNATTPIAPEAAEAMLPLLGGWHGNPSSAHPFGTEAKSAVDKARDQVADALGCTSSEIVFTSGGTESNNHAIRGVALARRPQGKHIVTTSIEHPAVINVCRRLLAEGFRLTVLPVDGRGLVSPDDLGNAITSDTILVSVMHANNEVGTIQPIKELAEIAHAAGALMHTDAAQSVGKTPVDVAQLGVDLLSVAGHKVYAPKGVGALYIREGLFIEPLMYGAGQESGRRPGTENVLEIVALGAAAEIASRELHSNMAHYRMTRDRLWDQLLTRLGAGGLCANGHPAHGLANTLSVSFRDVESDRLLGAIGNRVAVSAGAACHAQSVSISSVLQAMDLPLEWARGTIRFSVGRGTTLDEVDEAADVVAEAVRDQLGSVS